MANDHTDDVISYLKSDSSLDSLLGASSSDSKIYPLNAPQGATDPFIVYGLFDEGTEQEILKEFTMFFNIYSQEYDTVKDIAIRLKDLLNVQDGLNYAIPSSNYIFRWSKLTSSTDNQDEEGTKYFFRTVLYHFMVHKL